MNYLLNELKLSKNVLVLSFFSQNEGRKFSVHYWSMSLSQGYETVIK